MPMILKLKKEEQKRYNNISRDDIVAFAIRWYTAVNRLDGTINKNAVKWKSPSFIDYNMNLYIKSHVLSHYYFAHFGGVTDFRYGAGNSCISLFGDDSLFYSLTDTIEEAPPISMKPYLEDIRAVRAMVLL